MKNVIIGFLCDHGFKSITLSSCIIAEDETDEFLSKPIAQTFKESSELLETWRAVTVELFPN